MKPTGRPRRTSPARRFNLTLDDSDVELLEAYAEELGRQPTRIAGELLRSLLRGASGPDGRVERRQVNAMLRTMRGEDSTPASDRPRWEWPVEAILADRRWFDRWLPDLNELLGRSLGAKRGRYGEAGQAPVLDRRGYSDLLEFLFPTVAGPRGAVSWPSPDYPEVVVLHDSEDADADLRHVWESVIRHVVRALCALEKSAQLEADPVMGILTQDHIAGPWLRTLRALTGEKPPELLPSQQALPQKALV